MKQNAREVWSDRVKRWMASGKSAADFAETEGCRPKALMVWRWQLGLGPRKRRARLAAASAKSVKPHFVELLAPSIVGTAPNAQNKTKAALPFEITLISGVRVVVPAHFDHSSLSLLLDAVGGR